ncbi:hypothetical protein R69927_05728 [Paraburkholderia domus]|jgi:hypothetical protein|uniref:Uncharacterized protein n=1 Tax=Paraburkholderia domus TaxID=2793075 RepID=A0A9N8R3G0_9BURK|nr:hypothetical protein R75483_04948 [Paraburkholderia domus]CAE6845640.1 hypothetical protein R70006_07319 [Paraburkholderia domus]CAE6886280.1 hypothetical protein R69749_07340 [Paraburkholderia domus]CAE6906738.1 hypothetical protein R69927_05728 [Paraburkholderia domus]CAE6931178.1 hypothetical protein R70199_05494 [Paraburkholderia domus]
MLGTRTLRLARLIQGFVQTRFIRKFAQRRMRRTSTGHPALAIIRSVNWRISTAERRRSAMAQSDRQ